jgi:DNA repair ATPase RecN
MNDRELMQQALEALEEGMTSKEWRELVKALRERLAQPNEFNPDWDAMAVMVAEQQRMATEIERLKDGFNKSESRLHDVAVHCERVERRLKDVNTAAMKLTHDLVCMDYDDDERLDRDRVMARIMQWRNEWDKAMFEERNT